MKDYVIRWRSLKTNARGEGTALFTYEEAVRICDRLNAEFRGQVDHWEYNASLRGLADPI